MGGADAITALEVILRGKVIWGSSSPLLEQRNHKSLLSLTMQESERDYKQNQQKENERWTEKEKEAQMVAEMCECSSLGCPHYYVSTINARIEMMARAYFSNTTAQQA